VKFDRFLTEISTNRCIDSWQIYYCKARANDPSCVVRGCPVPLKFGVGFAFSKRERLGISDEVGNCHKVPFQPFWYSNLHRCCTPTREFPRMTSCSRRPAHARHSHSRRHSFMTPLRIYPRRFGILFMFRLLPKVMAVKLDTSSTHWRRYSSLESFLWPQWMTIER